MVTGFTRRQALGVIGAGMAGAGLVLSTSGCTPTSRGDRSPVPGPSDGPGLPESTAVTALHQPDVVESSGGVLELALRVSEEDVMIAGSSVRMMTYNGTVPGPTLHLHPGDRLRVRLRNDLGEPTNLHTHGLLVSASGNGDNPFVEIGPGETFDYEIALPDDHPSGVFWYHPHHHGMVADQLFAGLYGAIVVDEDDWRRTAPLIAVVSDVTVAGGTVAAASGIDRMMGRTGQTLLVNGQPAAVLRAAPGSQLRMLVVNACASRYLDLGLGDFAARLRGIDSGRRQPQEVDRLVLAPGNRADIVMTAPEASAELIAAEYDRGHAGMGMMGGTPATSPETVVLTVDPDAAARAAPVAAAAPAAVHDLRRSGVDGTRTLTMTMGMGGGAGMRFLLDGREYDRGRVDQRVRLGTVEQWTIRNASGMAHPFHLHVWPMQVVGIDGRDVADVDVRDVVDVPAGASVSVRIAFDRHPGKTVYHCHILDHEDLGMMGVAEVVAG